MIFWLLTSEFPPLYGGGISTYCLETAKMLASFGNEVTIITPDFSISEFTEKKEGKYTVVRFNPNKYYTSSFLGYEAHLSYGFAEIVKELILKNGAPDIIESQEYMGIAYYLLQYKWLQYPIFKNLKVVVTLHAPSFLYLEYNQVSLYQLPYFWTGEMERFCIRAADLAISPSQYLVDALKSRMILNDITVHIIKNPYNISTVQVKSQIKKNKITFFGKLIPQKGCLELIRNFKELWNEGFEHPLFMIGGGSHLYHPEGIDMIDFINKKYKAEIESGKLKLLGSVAPSKIDEYLNDSHIIVIPSIVDNLPYTVLEAMGRKKIVLASVQGGQSEIIENNVDGFLFDHNQPDSFKSQIKNILSLSDEDIRKTEECAFQKIKEGYNYNTIYERKTALINKLLENKKQTNDFPFINPIIPAIPIKHSGKESLLSVVIPYYNMGDYVEECIVSIQKSSYKNIEIILVNDGSNDTNSVQALENYKNIPSINTIHKKNEGLALARNTGAMSCQGKYIAFLDPDDTITEDYYEKAIRVLEHYENVCFVGCWAKYFGDATGYWPSFNPEPPYLLVHNTINSSALVYKKEAFIKAGLNDPQMIYGMEDYESVINMVKHGYQGVVLPEPLWNYRIRKNSMARAFTRNKQIYLYRLIANKHMDIYSKFASDVTNLLNANGPGINYDNPTINYSIPGVQLFGNKFKQLIISTIKSNRLLRKAAVKLNRIYKNI